MGTRQRRWRPRLTDRSWVLISLVGLLMLAVPLYDMWDDISNLSWGVATTLVENSVFILLSIGLVYGGFWLARKDWDPEYTWTVAKWNLAVVGGITLLYGLVIFLQLWAMGRLKPWILVLDGVLFGSVASFGIGTYSATQQIAQDDLERSREEYRTLTDDVLDASDVATFVLDDDFRIVWINEAAAAYFDLDRDEIIGRSKRDLVDDHIAALLEEPDRFRELVTATYEDNSYTEEFECHVTPGAGPDERWLQHWSQPIETGLYEDGRIEQYTDVTALKRQERELDLRERKLREMYEVVSDASRTFEEQVDGIISIGRELLGAEYGAFAHVDRDTGDYELEVVQSEQLDAEAGDVVPLAETHCEQMIAADQTLQFETRPFDVEPREYGTDADFQMYVGTPVYENDTVYGSLCFLDREEATPFDDWELTLVELMGNWMGYELNRKHLLEERQQQLREQEAKLEEFVETVDNYAIFTLDAGGHVTSWNRGAKHIKGYTADEIVGEHIETFYPEDLRNEGVPERLLTEAEETGQARHEGWRVRGDGTTFWADVTIAARYEDGEHVGYTKVVKDLTERREHERAIEHERERLEFLNRIIRHNILNGLNLVNARAEILETRFADDPDAREHLDTIRSRVEDLSSLIDTMRTFMDAILTDSDHETGAVKIREELDEKIALAEESYGDAVFDVHDLPDEQTEVVADELLGELFENVLSNAVVHNDKDTPRVEVWTSETTYDVRADSENGGAASRDDDAVEERDALVVHVADNGPGIPDEEKEAVLEKGVSELSKPGNGFGLYLVKEMMQAYGGEVNIRDNDSDEFSGGTVFDLVFRRRN